MLLLNIIKYIFYMSYVLNWIKENLLDSKKSKPEENNVTIPNSIESNKLEYKEKEQEVILQNENSSQVVESKNIKKWAPNDALYDKYNKFLNNVNKIKRHRQELSRNIERSKFLIKEYTGLKAKNDVESKINASMTKQELLNIESKIKQGEDAIKELDSIDSNVLDEWDNYVEEARNFLVTNQIDKMITTNDILTTQALLITVKKYLDGYVVTVSNEEYLEALAQIELFFDIKAINNSKTKLKFTQKEFEDKKNDIVKRIGNSEITSDLSVPHKLNASAYNENPHDHASAPNINITGSVQMVIATPVNSTNAQINSGIPIASAYIDNTSSNTLLNTSTNIISNESDDSKE